MDFNKENKGLSVINISKHAELGDADAQYTLAQIYDMVIKMCENNDHKDAYTKSVYWYSEAAKGGHVGACDALGEIFYEGIMVDKDIDASNYWYDKVEDKGFKSLRIKDKVKTKMLKEDPEIEWITNT